MLRARAGLGRWATALALLCSPGLASAAIPVGHFEISLAGNQSIWFAEIGDDEAFCVAFAEGLEDVEYCDFEMFVDGKGKLTGYLDFAAWSDDILISLHGPLKGSQRGDGQTGFMRADFSLKLVGEASDGDISLAVKASIKYTGQVAPGGVASGSWDQRFCVQGGGCESYQTVAPMETLTHGAWLLELEIGAAGGGALNGGARAEFGDGSECFYAIEGKYSAKTDVASLALTPITPECAGTSIQWKEVRSPTPGGSLGSLTAQLRYRLFGFNGDTTVFSGDLPHFLETAGSQSSGASANQELFAFICSNTLTIAASVDPGACAWSISGSGQPLSSATSTVISNASATATIPEQYAGLVMQVVH